MSYSYYSRQRAPRAKHNTPSSRPFQTMSQGLYEAFELINPDRGYQTCAGYAPSQGRRCRNPIAGSSLSVKATLDRLSRKSPSSITRDDLDYVAEQCLCRRWHQGQVDDVLDQWMDILSEMKEDREEPSNISRSDLMGMLNRIEQVSQRQARENQEIQAAMQELRIRQLEATIQQLRISALSTSQRVTDIVDSQSSGTRESQPTTSQVSVQHELPTQTAATNTTPSPVTSEESPAPTSSRPRDQDEQTDSNVDSRAGDSEPEVTQPEEAETEDYNTDSETIVGTDTDSENDDSDEFLSLLNSLFKPKTPLPEASEPINTPKCKTKHVVRRPLTDECSICFEPCADRPLSELVWCKGQCGGNFCRGCIAEWIEKGVKEKCPNCRSTWQHPCEHDGELVKASG